MTFRFSDGKIIETGDCYSDSFNKEHGTKFYITGDAHGCVTFHVAWKEGKRRRQLNCKVRAETILVLADAIKCCPNQINEDPSTGAKGEGYPPTWIGHALWHLQNPTAIRPCLEHGTEIIDVDRALTAGDPK